MFDMKPRRALKRLACACALSVLAVTSGSAEEAEVTAVRVGSLDHDLIRAVVQQTIAEMGQLECGDPIGPSCCDCCHSAPCCCARWEAGFEATLARPFFSGDSSLQAFGEDATGDNEFDVLAKIGYEFAPRLWLEAPLAPCLGARVRYWAFDGSGSTAAVDVNSDELETANADFEMRVLDVEATYHWSFCGWSLVTSGGIRYLRTETLFVLTETDLSSGVLEDQFIDALEFEGIGPTIALEAKAPIACCRGLSLFINLRGSLVGGNTDGFSADVLDNETFIEETEDIIWVTDLQTGLEYKQWYGCREMFFRVAAEGTWFDTSVPPSPFGRPAESFGVIAFSAAGGWRW
jgi:hypothetical protein